MPELKYKLEKNKAFPIFNSSSHPGLFRYHEKLFRHSGFVELDIPISVFSNSSLSSLETISKYIKEELGLSFREMSFILNRDERTIWGAYHSAQSKMNQRFSVKYTGFFIPLSIIKERKLSILESITEYLKEQCSLRYCKIAVLLNRDDRTIWTVYKRAKKKRADNENIAG
jgi:hypothetical protein